MRMLGRHNDHSVCFSILWTCKGLIKLQAVCQASNSPPQTIFLQAARITPVVAVFAMVVMLSLMGTNVVLPYLSKYNTMLDCCLTAAMPWLSCILYNFSFGTSTLSGR